jgi:hypothetical protein
MAKDDLEAAFGRMESGEKGEAANDNSSSGGKHEDNAGEEIHSMHHVNAGGKHHVTKHSAKGVEHSSHEAGEEKGDCPLCGGTGKE